ncbi:hypothetical protein A3753_14930 [Sulfitobacter sp. HI0082]|nr:hypothetical protein A3753_14930 [Sulfitobacter sp. HI0082]
MDDFYAARDNTMPSLPWPSIAPPFTPEGAANSASHVLFDAWVDRRVTLGGSSSAIWSSKLAEFLEATLEHGFSPVGPEVLRNAFGFWDDTSLYVNDHAWSTAFGAPNQKLAANALINQGSLIRDGNHYKTKAPRAAGSRERYYRLRRTSLEDRINVLIAAAEKQGSTIAA